MPLDSLTRATFRSAEFGFFGVVVYTRVQTPRRCGEPLRAGVAFFSALSRQRLRTDCWMAGTTYFLLLSAWVSWCPMAPTSRPAAGQHARSLLNYAASPGGWHT